MKVEIEVKPEEIKDAIERKARIAIAEYNESQRKIDNRLLEMIQRHFPSLPLDDRYTDWPKWLKFANAVRSEALNEVAGELEQHNSHWEAWYLRQRAAGVMPEFNEKAVPSNARYAAWYARRNIRKIIKQ